ncbi:major capsid protein [Wolbachia endosymbiont (group A) of Scambus nigricans]|nr:major capsid protein [Wolbachia endosymbiont (group A) of Scambus nigricans]
MLLACYSHKHISYRIRTIIRKAIHTQSNPLPMCHRPGVLVKISSS